ncbi:hypothetical protein [Peribacillus muralis]|uniref:hypothetical protein n=1 Tax=Peribacillus muralis TaxID=264697 RepID=UPI003CFD93A3
MASKVPELASKRPKLASKVPELASKRPSIRRKRNQRVSTSLKKHVNPPKLCVKNPIGE